MRGAKEDARRAHDKTQALQSQVEDTRFQGAADLAELRGVEEAARELGEADARARCERKSFLLTTYWSESTIASR